MTGQQQAEASAGSIRLWVEAVGVVDDGHGSKRQQYKVTITVGGRDPHVDPDGVRSGVGVEPDAPAALRRVVRFLLAIAEAPRGSFTLFPTPVEDSARNHRAALARLLAEMDGG